MAALYTLPGGSAKVANRTITSSAADTSDLVIEGQAVLELDGSTVSNTGSVSNPLAAQFYGVGATIVADGAAIYLNSDNVSASGFGVPAVFATDGAAIVLNTRTSVSTSRAGAPAIELINGARLYTNYSGLSSATYGTGAAALAVGAGSSALMFQGSLSTADASSDAIVSAGAVNMIGTAISAGRSLAALDGAAALTAKGVYATAGGPGLLVQNTSGVPTAAATVSLERSSLTTAGDIVDVSGGNLNLSVFSSTLAAGSGTLLKATSRSAANAVFTGSLTGNVVADSTSAVNVFVTGQLQGQISNAALNVAAGSVFISTGPSSITSLTDNYNSTFGTISGTAGLLSVAAPTGTIDNFGLIGANGGTVELNAATFVNYGYLTISGSGTLWLTGKVLGGSVLFAGNSGTLRLDNPAGFTAAIGGFSAGDVLDLGAHSVSFANASPYSNGSLHLLVDGAAANLSMPGSYPGNFHLGQGGNGDAMVFYSAS